MNKEETIGKVKLFVSHIWNFKPTSFFATYVMILEVCMFQKYKKNQKKKKKRD